MSFRDVKDTIRSFSGDDNYPIELWVTEFEENAILMNWNQLQLYIFAKNSLKGLAKLLIQGERGLRSWGELKQRLLEEFSSKLNSAQVHKMLSDRKIKKDESVQEYFLVMRELASRGSIETEALIQYVIDGITDDLNKKTVLFGARNLIEFKEKLNVYVKIKNSLETKGKGYKTSLCVLLKYSLLQHI